MGWYWRRRFSDCHLVLHIPRCRWQLYPSKSLCSLSSLIIFCCNKWEGQERDTSSHKGVRCSPSRAITYHQALIISAPARAFPRPRGSFGNALSKASQWKICKGFGTSNYQVVKILTTTKSLESEKQWHTPRPFQQGSAPRPLYWGSALRPLAQEVKLFLEDSTSINFSFSWLSSFALFSILTLGWSKVVVVADWKSVFRAKLPFLWFTTYHLIKSFF